MIDHLIFNSHKFVPDNQIISNYVDITLIGKTITYNKYRIGWADLATAYNLNHIDEAKISWHKPDNVDNNIASKGTVRGLQLTNDKNPYYTVWFDHTVDSGSGDGLYIMVIKASDLMRQNMSGNGL